MKDKMRVYHRYLGFFLSGIMAVYAISGIILIFRNTDFLKRENVIVKQLEPGLTIEKIGEELRLRDLKLDSTIGTTLLFRQSGTYNVVTGEVRYKVKELPYVLKKMTDMHKANTKSPLFFLNIFFGLSLLFFVISAFYMFLPKTTVFRKGLYFAAGGILLALVVIFF